MARRTYRPNPADLVLGFVLAVVGVLLVAATVLRLVPSVYALGGLALAAGALAVAGSFVGRTQAGFWAELVAGTLMATFGLLVVRFPNSDARVVALLAAFAFLAAGVVRLGSAREFPSLRGPFLVSGALSLFMGGLVLSDVIAPSATQIGVLIGCALIIDGVTAAVVGRAEHPSKRRS